MAACSVIERGEDSKSMGKYKLWLHHQEIGRRLRDQINTLEQERARVQKMAPINPTSLPEMENPVITALVAFTQNGNKLSNIDVIKAAMPKLDKDPDQRQPATSAATVAPVAARPAAVSAVPASPAASTADGAVVASLLARAEQMPSDPLEQMQAMSRSREQDESTRATTSAQTSASAKPADSVGGWLQRRRLEDQE